jgi:hypothetical protein
MNKKALGVLIGLLTVSMFAFPVCSVLATKDIHELKGSLRFFSGASTPSGSIYARAFYAGESGSAIIKWTDYPIVCQGDIEAGSMHFDGSKWVMDDQGGVYNGNWVLKFLSNPDKDSSSRATGIIKLEDVEVKDVGTGDLTLSLVNGKLVIVKGTGDLKGLQGKGELTNFQYTLVVHLNPD